MAILEVKHISYTYGAGTPFVHTALDDVSLSIERGEMVGIMGHTGSGKSTLIQHFNGLLKPTSGQVLLDGQDIWADGYPRRQAHFRVGLVFQYPEYQLFEETVSQDIAFGPTNMGLPPEEIQRRVREAMSFVGLGEDVAKQSPFALSGGQKRRVAIAGVIAMEPDVLILDEPTAGLDPQGREEILSEIRAFHQKKNATVLFVSHSMEDIARTVQRIVVMNQSRLMLDGTPEEVFSHAEELQQAGLGVPQVTQVFDELRRRGLDVPRGIYTVDQALAALRKRKEARHA